MMALMSQWRLMAGTGVLVVALGLFALWRLEAGHARRLQAVVAAAQTAQREASAQASAADDAETVVAQGAARDDRTHQIHEENSHALAAVSGSVQGLVPDLNLAGRHGLCGYASYRDDPACVQLRGDGPRPGPPAGGADRPAGR